MSVANSNSLVHPKQVTLVIHGTFADDEDWWKLGKINQPTFADRLETALSRRGTTGTVWKPVLDSSFKYTDFAWSGKNRDKDRVKGGRKLGKALNSLAGAMAATKDSPLTVNLVGHSHGGNVILEALKYLGNSISIGRVALLGTPLISLRPSLRVFRIFVALVMLWLIGLFAIYVLMQLGVLYFTGEFFGTSEPEDIFSVRTTLLLIVPILTFYAWVFRFLAFVGDVLWRLYLSPFLIAFGQWAGQAYGSKPSRMARILNQKPAILFTSYQDEADLLLQLGAAPRELYRETVAATWGRIGRMLEFIFLRPIVIGLILRALEVLVEHLVLGFSWLSVLFMDYEMADLNKAREYPPSVIEQRDVTSDLVPAARAKGIHALPPIPISSLGTEDDSGTARRVATLRESLESVAQNLISQIKLRHSLYYESNSVIEQVADALAGPITAPKR